MNSCWVLIVTRGLKVWLPPELYLRHDLAWRESARWQATFGIPAEPEEFSSTSRCLHLVPTSFPEPWRACPVWVGVMWSVRNYPRPKIELMAANEREAAEWVRLRVPKATRVDQPGHIEFNRRGVLSSVGVFKAKRVMGF